VKAVSPHQETHDIQAVWDFFKSGRSMLKKSVQDSTFFKKQLEHAGAGTQELKLRL